MFNLNEFIITNTVNGVKNGTFSKEYANIMAVNYMLKGVLTQDDVVSINAQIEAWENATVEIPIEEPTEENGEIHVEDIMTEEVTEPEEESTEEPLTEDDGEPLS